MNGITNEAVLDQAVNLAGPEFPVGTRFAYSGMGYVLLSMIVATVSGQSFAEFLKAKIFDPLGMKHTVAYDQSRPTRHKLAHGYLQMKDRFERWDYPMLTVGDGGLFSTLDDLFLWDQVLNADRLVPAAWSRPSPPARPTTARGLTMASAGPRMFFPIVSASERAQLRALSADLRYVAQGVAASLTGTTSSGCSTPGARSSS